MLKEIYVPLNKLFKSSVDSFREIASNKENLDNPLILQEFQELIISFGNSLEENYALNGNEVIHKLENICEILYEYAKSPDNNIIHQEEILNILDNLYQDFLKNIPVTDYNEVLIVPLYYLPERLEEYMEEKLSLGTDHFYFYDFTKDNKLYNLLEPYIIHTLVTYEKPAESNFSVIRESILNKVRTESYNYFIDENPFPTDKIDNFREITETIRCTLCERNDYTEYFTAIRDYRPSSILDVGMFLKRSGFISPCYAGVSIDTDTTLLDGVDVMPKTDAQIYSTIYKKIFTPFDFLRLIENEQSSVHYDLIFLIKAERFFDSATFDKIKNWCLSHGTHVTGITETDDNNG